MALSPLTRLVRHARKNPKFFQLLHTDRAAALKQAAAQGIELSASELKTLQNFLSGRRVVLKGEDVARTVGRGYGKGSIPFWDIFCHPKRYQRVVQARAAKKSRKK